MITYHASVDGGSDYLDFHTSDSLRFYLPRHEMRSLLRRLTEAVGGDVVCEQCGMLNGVHRVGADGGRHPSCGSAGTSTSA